MRSEKDGIGLLAKLEFNILEDAHAYRAHILINENNE